MRDLIVRICTHAHLDAHDHEYPDPPLSAQVCSVILTASSLLICHAFKENSISPKKKSETEYKTSNLNLKH